MAALMRALVAAAVLTFTSACGLFGGEEKFQPANPAAVGLSIGLKDPVHIGLVVSPNAPAGEGRDVAALAAGARVAQVRYAQGGARVVLDVEDDRGTADGSRAAVQALVAKEVVGIVYASEGPHLAAGLRVAEAADVAVLLPYAGSLPVETGGSWLTGPSTAQVLGALRSRLAAEGLGSPAVLSVGPPPEEITALGDAVVTVLDSTARVPAAALTGRRAVLVWASAQGSAQVVGRLQAQGVTVPVLLGPSALSTGFATTLTVDETTNGAATLAGRYLTAGIPTTTDSPHAVGFAAAVRLAAGDPSTLSVTGNTTFGARGADTADGRSHDAVIALVRAADRAGGRGAAGVLETLRGLWLGRADGLVGPSLSFTSTEAVADSDVVPLQSSTDPIADRLVWFALPAPQSSS